MASESGSTEFFPMESMKVEDMWTKMRAEPEFGGEKLPLDDQGLENAKVISVAVGEFETFGFSRFLEEYLGFLVQAISKRSYPNLEKLEFDGTNERVDNAKRMIHKFLENASWVNLPNLKSLVFVTAVRIGGIKCIVKAAQQGLLPKLSALEFRGNRIKDEGLLILMRAANSGHLHTLEDLILDGEGLTRSGIVPLGEAMEAGSLERLQSLALAQDSLGDEGGEALAEALRSGKVKGLSCLKLVLETHEGLIDLINALQVSSAPSLKDLLIFMDDSSTVSTTVPKEGAELIAQAMISRRLSKLENLALHRFKGGDILVDGLAGGEFAGLKSLMISRSSLGREAARTVVDLLKRWPSLETLYIAQNPLGDEAIVALAETLAAGHVRKLRELVLADTGMQDEGAVAIAEVLAKESNLLPNLERLDLSRNYIGERGAAALVNAYRKNPFLTATLDVEWPEGSPWEGNYEGFRSRNLRGLEAAKILREYKEKEPARLGRVFLCGEPEVGKTTLRKSLAQAYSGSYRRSTLLARARRYFCPGQHATEENKRTRGIEMSSISLPGPNPLTLSVWDLAGQDEYHVLHAAFFPESAYMEVQATLFVVLFRDKGESPTEADLSKLQYWFRFIASSSLRGIPGYERRVMVVRNRHGASTPSDKPQIDSEWSEWIHRFKADFQDFMQIELYNVSFDVRSVERAKQFGEKLFIEAERLLLQKEIPKICADLQSAVQSWGKDHKDFPIAIPKIIEDLVREWRSEDTSLTDENHRRVVVNAALKFLNQVGTIIFFPEEAFSDELELSDGELALSDGKRNLVVADPEWFCRKVVGDLLLPASFWEGEEEKRKNVKSMGLRMDGQLPSISIDGLKRETLNELKLDDTQMEQTVAILIHLGLCFKVSQSSIFFPALAPKDNNLPQWWHHSREDELRQWVMGLSLTHMDADKTLMPASLFYKFQVLLVQHPVIKNAFDNEFCAGPNFLAFKAMRMNILIEFHVDEKIPGRIDFLVKPSENTSCTEGQGEEVRRSQVSLADELVTILEEARRSCYPGVRLETRVIKPWSASIGHLEMVERDVRQPLQKVLEGLLEIQIDSKGDWKKKLVTEWTVGKGRYVDEVKREDLLRAEDLSKWVKHLTSREKEERVKVQSVKEILSELSRDSEVELAHESSSRDRTSDVRNTPEMQGVEQRLSKLEKRVSSIEKNMCHMQETLRRLQDGLSKSFANQEDLWLRLISLEAVSFAERERSIPRYIYFKERKSSGKWLDTFSKGLERSATLHFLCESREGNHGFHEMERQKGYDLSLRPDWLHNNVVWLKWSLCIASVGVSLGTALIPGLNVLVSPVLGGALQMAQTVVGEMKTQKKAMDALRFDFTSAQNPLEVKGPSKEALQELIGDANSLTRDFIKRHFNLTMVFLSEGDSKKSARVLWVCDDCVRNGRFERIQDYGRIHHS